jgi:hypothetical protein
MPHDPRMKGPLSAVARAVRDGDREGERKARRDLAVAKAYLFTIKAAACLEEAERYGDDDGQTRQRGDG